MPARKKKWKSYAERLESPQWQKKRLEVLERDRWACLECGTTTATLHVHHAYYEPKKEPWDYPTETLFTFCGGCHEAEEARLFEIRKLCGMGRKAVQMCALEEARRATATFARGKAILEGRNPDAPDNGGGPVSFTEAKSGFDALRELMRRSQR